ncbi:DoxX family protein [Acidisphaera sp. L21]|uniref:DoxX family protein n=1 Tax=Acidisphaera sp. L21 TaxID=1641851 RepID=UPI00131C975E|nr:DoxX family protein [Acidisphaera sp. L21]
MKLLLALFGGAVAVAGADKLTGNKGYARMFRHLEWSDNAMRAAAIAETAGGVLMIPPATRRLGGAIVAAVSTVVIASELQRGDSKLAAPRALVLLGGLLGVVVSQRT